jgi:tRNA pseudouridine55 synthase
VDGIREESTRLFADNISEYPEGIVLPIDKPYRWTSADVVRKIKFAAIRHFGKKNLKVGHAGTLDPLATGLLLVCIGEATKRAESLQASAKEYIAGVTFGAVTASYDLEKDIDRLCPLDGVSEESLRALLPSFVGEQMQVAPLFSAKSVDGVRAYETARKLYRQGRLEEGSDLISANRIEIYSLELLSFGVEPFAPPAEAEGRNCRINVADISAYSLPTAMIRVSCSKGTYIRALARDLGEALGSGAFLSSLRRSRNGGFTLDDAISLDDALAQLQ